MKFTVSTKPLVDALGLGIVDANVSKFYKRSCLAQITFEQSGLRINLEAESIISEINLKGKVESYDKDTTIFVDSLLLKKLVSTFDSNIVSLECLDGGVLLTSGKSRFTLAKMMDVEDMQLREPAKPESFESGLDISKENWKFIKDHQMYAIAMSFVHPVYTNVWIGSSGDVLVGDADKGLFTHSTKNNLGDTCLVTDTIVNLFNSLPENSKIYKHERNYIVAVETDGYTLLTEISPKYEDDPKVGKYLSDMIMGVLEHPVKNTIKVNTAAITKFLNQASILSTSSDDSMYFSVYHESGKTVVELRDHNGKANIEANGDVTDPYDVEFISAKLKDVISNYSSETVTIAPVVQEDAVSGILVWDDELTTTLAGVDNSGV